MFCQAIDPCILNRGKTLRNLRHHMGRCIGKRSFNTLCPLANGWYPLSSRFLSDRPTKLYSIRRWERVPGGLHAAVVCTCSLEERPTSDVCSTAFLPGPVRQASGCSVRHLASPSASKNYLPKVVATDPNLLFNISEDVNCAVIMTWDSPSFEEVASQKNREQHCLRLERI